MVKFCFREHDIYAFGLHICISLLSVAYIFGMILCIISALVPSKKKFYMQVCVAVSPCIFGCSSMFSKISVANVSSTATVFLSAAIQFHTFKSTALCRRINTARQCTVCSPVYCSFIGRHASALDTWTVFYTTGLQTYQNEHFAYTHDIAVCIRPQHIDCHLSAYFR